MDFNTDCSSFKSTFIEEKNDNNENIFSNSYHCIALKKNSSTFLISKESELNSTTQEGSISLRMETKPKIIETCSNSYIINQEDFTYQKSESPDSFENFNALLEYEQTECLLKQRLSSIAELKESDSYHDYHKFAKDKLIEEKIVYEETSKEIISEKNSIESSSLKKISASSRKSQSKKLMFENKINHSTPILTSETQIEIYKILNLDQGASGMNILQELENRKNMQNRSVTLSANSEKKNRNEINQRKRVTTDDTYSDKNKIKKLNCKSYKTFQNVNYSSKLTSILKEDPLKKIEQEYEEDKNNTDKIMSDSYVLSILRSNPEKINSQPQIRMKNIACMKDLSSSSKCLFTCVLVL